MTTEEEIREIAILCIDAYEEPQGEWDKCPNCNYTPKVWEFNNGASTACACGESKYNHFSIHAESIMSHHKRHDGSVLTYDCDALRKNWNHWTKTGEELFKHAQHRNDERW